MKTSNLSKPLVIIFLFISFQRIYSQEYHEIRCDTSYIERYPKERLIKWANFRNIPIRYSKNRRMTIAYEKYYEKELSKFNLNIEKVISLLELSYDKLTNVILSNNSTNNEINESITSHNGFTYLYDAAIKNYDTFDILLADIHSSYGGYSNEYINKYWRTRRTFKESLEDKEITFFIIRGVFSKLTLILSFFLFIFLLRKYFKKKRI
ncbi:MAG: hypothetical protein P8I51_04405 [Polaribacter sp.]|nr:hypothetical protein [Polaribacter sp.]